MSATRTIPQTLRAWITSPETELSRWQRIVTNAVALALHCTRELRRDRAPQMAAALAYRTIFGLIPSLVLSLIVLRFFYGDSIETPLRRLLDSMGLSNLALPPADAAGESQAIGVWIQDLVQRVSSLNFAAIGVVGVAVLIYAALSLMTQIEQAFNTVYKAGSGRSILARLTQYWTILTLGPIGVFASFWLGDRSVAALQSLGAGSAVNALGVLPALAVSWLVLLLAYTTIPHARVRLRPALAGSFVAAVLWEIGKWGFGQYLGFATGYARFYGSLGLLPVFLLWVYLTWLIVLFGLELSYASQTLQDGIALLRRSSTNEPVVDPATTLAVLGAVTTTFDEGAPADVSRLARSAGVTIEQARTALMTLARAGAVHQIERPDDEPAAWALSKPPGSIRLSDVADSLLSAPLGEGVTPAARAGAELIRDGLTRALEGRTAADLARGGTALKP